MISCRPKGGIKDVRLIDVSQIAGLEYDQEGSVCTGLKVMSQAGVVKYDILEDKSSYEESVSESNGFRVVKHTLNLIRGMVSTDKMYPVAEWMVNGCVALVTFIGGKRLLIGLSESFGMEYPLRLVSVLRNSGCKMDDGVTEKLTLESMDVSEAVAMAEDADISFVN